MKLPKYHLYLAFVLLLFIFPVIPTSQAQSYYQTYFWIRELDYPISAIQSTGDLNQDHVSLPEVVVGGQGNLTLLDAFNGLILANYSISTDFTYNALAAGDLDSDSVNEIVAGSKDGNLLVALDYDATNQTFSLLWSKNYNVTHLEICDITANSQNKVVCGDAQGNLTVFHANGNISWSYNLSEPINVFRCVDLTQDYNIDGILVLTTTNVTLLHTNGSLNWQVVLGTLPLNVLIGDINGDSNLEIIVKGQERTTAFYSNGTRIWDSPSYLYSSSALVLHDYTGDAKQEALVGIHNGTWVLNGTNGNLLETFVSSSPTTALAVSNFFSGSDNYLMMGDSDGNLTLWMLDGTFLYNITLDGPVIDILLVDMNADGILDIITASANGTVYVIGLPWMVEFTWLMIGVGIGCAIIAASIIVLLKLKKPPETASKAPVCFK